MKNFKQLICVFCALIFCLGTVAAGEETDGMEVRYEYMMPAEVDAAMEKSATLYIPLGTVEWHGKHNILGLDALKVHALCVRAAQRSGGVVHPPLFGGVGGLTEPHTFIIDEENSTSSQLVRLWVEKLISEGKRQGFKAVVVVTGHYGMGQQLMLRETAARMSRLLDIPVLGEPEFMLALDEGYNGDHAAAFETSLMMELFPDKVDLSRLGEAPHQGVYGADPKTEASREMGKRFADKIVGRLAKLGNDMPTWDVETRGAYIRAQEAMVRMQQWTAAGQNNDMWYAWGRMQEGALNAYPELLANGEFAEIEKLADDVK